MNRKGFTLVEILLVIAITAILLLIIVPNVFVLIEKNKEKSCNNLINNIESAAKIYVTNNKYNMGFGCNTSNNTKEITFQTLVDSGDLKLDGTGKMINPVTDKEISLNKKVKVTYDCTTKQFTYYVNGISCDKNVESEEEQTFTLNIISGIGGMLKVENTTKSTSVTASSGETATLSVAHGDTVKVIATSNTGYNLSTLKHGSTSLSSGSTFTVSSTEAIQATWSLKTFNISYDANGGTGAPASQIKEYGNTLTLSNEIPTKTGYTFVGWSTNQITSSSTSFTYEKGDSYINNNSATLYAVWYSNTQAVYSSSDNSLRFYNTPDIIRTGTTYNGLAVTAAYVDFHNRNYDEVNNTSPTLWNDIRENINYVKVEQSISPIDTSYWFKDFINTSKFDLEKLDTSNTTLMYRMFMNAGKNITGAVTLNLGSWNTSKVSNMGYMFHYAGYNSNDLSINGISDWDTSSIVHMKHMFSNTGFNDTGFSLNLGNWNTSNVTNMDQTFNQTGRNSTTFTLGNINNWNTSNVTDMYYMFQYAGENSNWTLDLRSWDVTKVTRYEGFNTGITSKVIAPSWK